MKLKLKNIIALSGLITMMFSCTGKINSSVSVGANNTSSISTVYSTSSYNITLDSTITSSINQQSSIQDNVTSSIENDSSSIDYSNKVVDLVMFMGQSNMAGRGDYRYAPKVVEGAGYEFKSISDPTKLYPLTEPFGIEENNIESGVSESTKTGSMVSSFVNSYYKYTNTPIVAVSCSKGGTKIDYWAPGSNPLNDAINRHELAKAWLFDNGYIIRNDFMVWCQGESDGDKGTTYDQYKTRFNAMLLEMQNKASVEKCFIVRIGNHRDNSTLYDEIIRAQTDLAKEDDDTILVSTRFASMAEEGLMKDTFHYYQEGYNLTGEEAGKNTAFYINNGIEPYMYDYEYKSVYLPFLGDSTTTEPSVPDDNKTILDLDFSSGKTIQDYIDNGIISSEASNLEITYDSDGAHFNCQDKTSIKLSKSLTLPENFTIEYKAYLPLSGKELATERDPKGYNLLSNNSSRPMLNIMYTGSAVGYQSRLLTSGGDLLSIPNLGISLDRWVNLKIEYTGTNLRIVDADTSIEIASATITRTADTFNQILGLSGTTGYSYGMGSIVSYFRIIEN